MLGEHMLQGWILSGDPCPTSGCLMPMMRSSSNAPLECVVCASIPVESIREPPTPVKSDIDMQEMTSTKKRDPSLILGDYMLQGWTMMNAGCDICNAPLMRSRDKATQKCVVCGEDNSPTEPSVTTQDRATDHVQKEVKSIPPAGVSGVNIAIDALERKLIQLAGELDTSSCLVTTHSIVDTMRNIGLTIQGLKSLQ